MMYSLTALIAALAASIVPFPFSTHADFTNITERSTSKGLQPIMNGQNFPDPSIIRTGNGWHIFSTNAKVNGREIHIQAGYSPDFETWTYRSGYDALPNLPPWINKKSPSVWAPDVNQLPDGSFIMYYTASQEQLTGKRHLHCLSWATSKNVEGPFVDNNPNPWICNSDKGGSIDPSGYVDRDGSRWIVYKIDGNSIGHGGSCGNTVPPIVPTPIMLQQVSAKDGHTLIGSPIQILDRGPTDGPYIEAPSLSYLNGKYVLFFSSNCFVTPKYDVSYATATNIKGPFTKYGPLFVTGDLGMTAPGGAEIAVNGNHFIWHA